MNKNWVQSERGVWLPANQDNANNDDSDYDNSANTIKETNVLKHEEELDEISIVTESSSQMNIMKIKNSK
jgi:hypothetical protein